MAGLGAAGVGSSVAAAALAALILLLIVFVGTNLLGVVFYYVAKRKNIAWLQYLSGCLLCIPITLLFVWACIINKPQSFICAFILLAQILYIQLIQKFYYYKKHIHITATVCGLIFISYCFWKSNQPMLRTFAYPIKNEKGDIIETEVFNQSDFVCIETQERPDEKKMFFWGQIKFIGYKALLLKCYYEYCLNIGDSESKYQRNKFAIRYNAEEEDITFSRIENIELWEKGNKPNVPNILVWGILEKIGIFLRDGDWISSQTELLSKIGYSGTY